MKLHKLQNGSWIALETVVRIAYRPSAASFIEGKAPAPAAMSVSVDANDQNKGEYCVAENNEQAQQWCDELAALVNSTHPA